MNTLNTVFTLLFDGSLRYRRIASTIYIILYINNIYYINIYYKSRLLLVGADIARPLFVHYVQSCSECSLCSLCSHCSTRRLNEQAEQAEHTEQYRKFNAFIGAWTSGTSHSRDGTNCLNMSSLKPNVMSMRWLAPEVRAPIVDTPVIPKTFTSCVGAWPGRRLR